MNEDNMKAQAVDYSFIYNPKKAVIGYAGISAFCLVFFLIYRIFSHNVYSVYMTYLFAWPLVLGLLPALILLILKTKNQVAYYGHIPSQGCLNLYRSGIAILTMSSLLKGVFEIAGTGSTFQLVMWPAGAFFLVAGIIDFFMAD